MRGEGYVSFVLTAINWRIVGLVVALFRDVREAPIRQFLFLVSDY